MKNRLKATLRSQVLSTGIVNLSFYGGHRFERSNRSAFFKRANKWLTSDYRRLQYDWIRVCCVYGLLLVC